MSLRSYICWVAINVVGYSYFLTLLWVLFHPESMLHTVFLCLHLFVAGTLLAIFITALLYIKLTTPSLSNQIWHGFGCNKASTMPIDMDILLINQRVNTSLTH